MNKEQLWQSALAELELSLSKANFTTWFKNTFILDYDQNQVTLGVPNAFTKAWLENKYHDSIVKALQRITEYSIKSVSYRVTTQRPAQQPIMERVTPGSEANSATTPAPLPPSLSNGRAGLSQNSRNAGVAVQVRPEVRISTHSASHIPLPIRHGFNPKYTFESFVIGKGNELAIAAAKAVSEHPGDAYNPLFIYGGAGLGKTHLIQAIGIAIAKRDPGKKILYVSCETFTNEFIQAISQGRGADFKNKYRGNDVLLIDDVQFLAGKEGTQEEFFHTFNYLHQSDRQIVLSSDRPPKAIPSLENRLESRFEWGMIVDVGVPDLETRIAILEAKCKEKGFGMDFEILHFIADVIQNNVRELEGALNRVIASHELNNTKPTLESTKELLSGLSSKPKHQALSSKQVISLVAEYFNIKVADVTGNSRKKELVTPRQIAMFLMREDMSSSFPTIGQELGGRDHTTAMHACTKIRHQIQTDEKIREDVNLIRQRLIGGNH